MEKADENKEPQDEINELGYTSECQNNNGKFQTNAEPP